MSELMHRIKLIDKTQSHFYITLPVPDAEYSLITSELLYSFLKSEPATVVQ